MTEQNTQIGWEERFEEYIENESMFDWRLAKDLIPYIRTELTKAREEGYEKGQDDAFNGRIQSMKSITITEEVNLVPELRKHIENLALQSYRQELRKKVEGMKKPVSKVMSLMMKKGIFGKPLNDEINPMYHYNKAIEDLLTIISE